MDDKKLDGPAADKNMQSATTALNSTPETAEHSSEVKKNVNGQNNDNEEKKKSSQSNEETGTPNSVDSKNREHTRSTMALLFVLGFFALLFLCFPYALIVNAELKELKDTLVAVIGALSGIFGFIVGYYYKSSQETI